MPLSVWSRENELRRRYQVTGLLLDSKYIAVAIMLLYTVHASDATGATCMFSQRRNDSFIARRYCFGILAIAHLSVTVANCVVCYQLNIGHYQHFRHIVKLQYTTFRPHRSTNA